MGLQSLTDLTLLFFIGLLTHIYAFTSNEYIDRDIDVLSADLTGKPLIKKSITPQRALVFALTALFIAFVLIILFFPVMRALLLFAVAIAYATMYNLTGKKFPGFEVLLGVWALIFCISAALMVGGSETPLLYLLAFLFLIQMWMACAIDGNMKDVDHDFKAGAKTVGTALGVRTAEGNRLIIPASFQIFCMALSASYIAIVLIFYSHWALQGEYWQLILVLVFGFVMLYAQYEMVTIKKFDRDKILLLVLWHQCPTVLIPLVMLAGVIGALNSFLLGIFIFVLSGIIVVGLYGTDHPPV
ncbi:MAG: UbiA prenyltransferase family protein [Thermoplasmata archaeon]|nr:MAG: UbiA prenyltransferase family protein [Thermoplasmata archaeon]